MGIMPFDFTTIEAATGFDYPEGDYIFEVDKTEERTNQDGQQKRLLVGNKIIMGPWASEEFKGRKLSNSYQYSQNGAKFIKRLLNACGFSDELIQQYGGNIEHEWLIGRQFVASVFKNGQYTNIGNERPISEWDPTKAPTATTTAGVPVSAPPPAIMQPMQPAQTHRPPVTGAPPAPPPVNTMVPPAMQAQQPAMPPPVMQQPVMPPTVAQQPVAPPPAVAPPLAAVQPPAAVHPPAMVQQPIAPPPVAAPPVAVQPPAMPQVAAPASAQGAGPIGIPAPAPPPGTPTQ